MELWNATYLGPSAKLLYFETQIATFVGIWEKLLLFETQIATFLGISKTLLLFHWKCCVSWEIYKFATFSINYVKLKLSAPPEPVHSGKYTGFTGLFKFVENI